VLMLPGGHFCFYFLPHPRHVVRVNPPIRLLVFFFLSTRKGPKPFHDGVSQRNPKPISRLAQCRKSSALFWSLGISSCLPGIVILNLADLMIITMGRKKRGWRLTSTVYIMYPSYMPLSLHDRTILFHFSQGLSLHWCFCWVLVYISRPCWFMLYGEGCHRLSPIILLFFTDLFAWCLWINSLGLKENSHSSKDMATRHIMRQPSDLQIQCLLAASLQRPSQSFIMDELMCSTSEL